MTSTFLGYRIYSNNLTQSLQRVAAEPANATDEKYYEANIGKVKSIDDFLNNYRLFTHAMTAYGLQDLGNAKALMKQVLESNLSDPNSVANRLNDSRYKTFAKAFNFTSKGTIATNGQLQTSTQLQDLMTRIDPLNSETAGIESSLAKVTSVSALESDDGLYTRVLSAFGLDSKTTLKSDVTAALKSDLSNPFSAANRPDITSMTINSDGTTTTTVLTNNAKLKAMAEDFNFAADGTIGSQRLIQSPQSVTAATTAYATATTAATAASVTPEDSTADAAAKVKAGAAAAQTETDYYVKKISGLTSVDQLVADPRLVAYVKTAFGLDANMSTTQVRGVLTSNLLDPKSLANTFNVDPTNPPSGLTRYQTFAQAFNIGTDGTAFDHGLVLSTANLTAATTAYTTVTTAATAASVTSLDSTDQAAAKVKAGAAAAQAETDYFTTTIPKITSVTALLSNSRLVSYVRTAFNLPAPVTDKDGNTTGTSLADLGNILRSNVLDPRSAANTLGADARKLATSFNFASGGTSWDFSLVQSAANLSVTTLAYGKAAASNGTDAATAKAETAYYTSTLATTTTVAGIVGDSRLVAYIRTAFNLPAPVVAPDGTTTTPGTTLADLTNILNSNLLDPTSAANTMGKNALTLAKAFDIGPAGMVYNQRPIQSAKNFTAMTTAYQALAGTSTKAKAAAQVETDYFTTTLPSLKSVDDLLGDKRLVAYISKAYNLPTNTVTLSQTKTLRQVLTSNLSDPKSKANLLGGGYQTLAAAFDISADGTIAHAPDQQLQTKAGLAATHTAFLNLTMETEAGNSDGDGVRLALYFKRVAPTITSAYGILADKALTSVVQTMLGLSSSSSKADIDAQARFISSKIKIADFKDPAKLDKLIGRFAALYDVTNNTTTDPTLALFTSSSG